MLRLLRLDECQAKLVESLISAAGGYEADAEIELNLSVVQRVLEAELVVCADWCRQRVPSKIKRTCAYIEVLSRKHSKQSEKLWIAALKLFCFCVVVGCVIESQR